MLSIKIKKLANGLGMDTHRFLFSIFERNASRILERKMKACDQQTLNLIRAEDERLHYGDHNVNEKAMETILTSFTLDRIQFIQHHFHPTEGQIVTDLGDSNGIFLRSCQKDGISVNISDPALLAIHHKGLEAVKAHIEYLPFKNNSIHTVFLFETLEHVPNPISLLREIGRVCSQDLIVSIPYVEKTKIYPYNYDPTRPIYQHHIFEFNRNDFMAILTHTPFHIESEQIATVVDDQLSFIDRIVFYLWQKFVEKDTFCGCFKRFYICTLSKTIKELPQVQPGDKFR